MINMLIVNCNFSQKILQEKYFENQIQKRPKYQDPDAQP